MSTFIAFLVCLALFALNAALYVADTSRVWNLGAAIFCGGCAAANLVWGVRR